jgi:MFS family permease
MGFLFGASWVLVAVAPSVTAPRAVLVAAIFVFSVAECLYDAVQGPLVAALAPADLLGRYLAVTAFSWQFGFIVGPAVGAILLAANPLALWLVAAVACVCAGIGAIRLDRRLPVGARVTPRSRRPTGVAAN